MESEKTLDTKIEIPVPELILFHHHTAGPVTRLFALMVDYFIIAASIFFIASLLALFSIFAFFSLSDSSSYLALFLGFIAFFIIQWGYFYFFEWRYKGRTPGKMIMGIRVVSLDGTRLTSSQVALRSLLRIADMVPIKFLAWIIFFPAYITGVATMFVSGKYFQRLGDLAAGTVVIFNIKNSSSTVSVIDEEEITKISLQLRMRYNPSPELTQALNDFVNVRDRLPLMRIREIAQTVEEPMRRYFSAEKISCEADTLLYAAHHHLYSNENRI